VKSGQTQQAERLVNFKFDPARDDVTGHMGPYRVIACLA
jgi:hypothetical protein